MDMNRKSRLCLINKKTLMAASFMIKFSLVLGIIVMLAAPTLAAPFLDGIVNSTTIDILDDDDNLIETVTVVDRSSENDDDWAQDTDLNLPAGYTGDDYKAGSPAATDNLVTYNYNSPVYYLGTFKSNALYNQHFGNNSEDLELLIKFFLGNEFSVVAYGKYEEGETDLEYDSDLDALSFEIFDKTSKVNEPNDIISGKWKITDSGNYDPDEKINFYSIKGSNEFALYYVDPQQSAGTWTTRHLSTSDTTVNIPGMSHFSVMRTVGPDDPGDPGTPIPEPATMLLFGFSLIGLAGMARRKNSKF